MSLRVVLGMLVLLAVTAWLFFASDQGKGEPAPPRTEVIFWHFWGGADREVVEDVVARFNDQQTEYRVRAIAMPGNNLTAKLFLSIAGGDPPDLINQDDPIVGDWAARGAILPWDQLATPQELSQLEETLLPAAKKLGSHAGRLYGVCNGLDIRALYYNQTILEQHGLPIPRTTDDLNRIATTLVPPQTDHAAETMPEYFGYLPDSRRLWAWGFVFGGQFFDTDSYRVTLDAQPVQWAAKWMRQFATWYGADTINAFRQGDQSLPGKSFPLLPLEDEGMVGRYVVMMDGQWRVRDIEAFLERRRQMQLSAPKFGVCALPVPGKDTLTMLGAATTAPGTEQPVGRSQAGWVNGNFFVVPKGCQQKRGAMEFVKFWIGLQNPQDAAKTCIDGGWIPVTQTVLEDEHFQAYLDEHPMFAEFVKLAQSEHQFPIPVIPGAPFFKRKVEQTAASVMVDLQTPVSELLDDSTRLIQQRLDEVRPLFEQEAE